MGCVVENAASLNMVFLYVLVSSARKCLRQAYHAVTGFPRKERENYMRVYGFSLGRTSGESYFCSRKRVITLKRKSGL